MLIQVSVAVTLWQTPLQLSDSNTDLHTLPITPQPNSDLWTYA